MNIQRSHQISREHVSRRYQEAVSSPQPPSPPLLVLWWQRIKGRYKLACLDARMLDDIGMTEAERDAKVRTPFWRPLP